MEIDEHIISITCFFRRLQIKTSCPKSFSLNATTKCNMDYLLIFLPEMLLEEESTKIHIMYEPYFFQNPISFPVQKVHRLELKKTTMSTGFYYSQ
ncbi:hypothetical protein CEXT_147531 [Caerostris extrusa]|uniref:Uncharacterized protein n=1 Tax=Caerostris extrusa TaxID=172846 RepID=A0AAV4SVX8_CAEEX|nr:hypothetical protein CEXT_147531 [Caerostris extrusa]